MSAGRYERLPLYAASEPTHRQRFHAPTQSSRARYSSSSSSSSRTPPLSPVSTTGASPPSHNHHDIFYSRSSRKFRFRPRLLILLLRRCRVTRILKLLTAAAAFVFAVMFFLYEPHVEISFYPRRWIRQEIEAVEPLAGCFHPSRVSEKYNVSEAVFGYGNGSGSGRRRVDVQAGMPMRIGMDCYNFAGTIHSPSSSSPSSSSPPPAHVIPPEERIQFHTYWRTDLAPFGQRQEYMLKSFFATQNLHTSRLVLWSNGAELAANPILKRYQRLFPDAFALKVVNMALLAMGTEMEGSPLLENKDKKAWVDGDLVRLLLLWNYGGVWVDMDSLLTRDLDPLLDHEFVTQWDCYDKIYQPMNGALMRFRQHSPYLCEAFHVMASSTPPRSGSTDWGSLLYFKLWRRLVAENIPPFSILPFCFSDGRSCRLDNRLPDPFLPDSQVDAVWTKSVEGSGRSSSSSLEVKAKAKANPNPRIKKDVDGLGPGPGTNPHTGPRANVNLTIGAGGKATNTVVVGVVDALGKGGKLDQVLNKVFGVHLHNQWEKNFPAGGWVDRLLLRKFEERLEEMQA